MSGDVGVERVFPINMPALQKIEVDRRGRVRRARIYYFRDLRGKKQESKTLLTRRNNSDNNTYKKEAVYV